MKDFSVSMALVDYIPVIFFAVASVILMRDLYNKMSKGAFALFAAGTINVTAAGYLSHPAEKVTDRAAKQEKTRCYVNGLLEKGGPSTDAFIKAIGRDKTTELFTNYLFNTK